VKRFVKERRPERAEQGTARLTLALV